MYNRVTLLGNAQDAGPPQFACTKPCCEDARLNSELSRMPVSLGLHGDSFGLIEATRCIDKQLTMVNNPKISDLWITHAHLGHIEGLGQFGKESSNQKNIQLHCSDSVYTYLQSHPTWNKLFLRGNLSVANFSSNNVKPIKVPHRSEDFETHAFLIKGSHEKLLFLPDHDTWEATLSKVECRSPRDWFNSLDVNIVLLDGTFWSDNELGNRSQGNVPHPSVKQTLELMGKRREDDPRIIFIHLNHTNPLHYKSSEEYQKVEQMGWEVGIEGMEFEI